jgi:hypothetical protein
MNQVQLLLGTYTGNPGEPGGIGKVIEKFP